MIASVSGKIIDRGFDFVVVEASGVGYKVFTSEDKTALGENVIFFTTMIVREDTMDLYGFLSKEDLTLFGLLVGVSGVGPKTALSLLRTVESKSIRSAITEKKPEYLLAPGVGKKTAERIVLELSGKLTFISENDDVLKALISLGYSINEARSAIKNIKRENDIGLQVKDALKELSKKS